MNEFNSRTKDVKYANGITECMCCIAPREPQYFNFCPKPKVIVNGKGNRHREPEKEEKLGTGMTRQEVMRNDTQVEVNK